MWLTGVARVPGVPHAAVVRLAGVRWSPRRFA